MCENHLKRCKTPKFRRGTGPGYSVTDPVQPSQVTEWDIWIGHPDDFLQFPMSISSSVRFSQSVKVGTICLG